VKHSLYATILVTAVLLPLPAHSRAVHDTGFENPVVIEADNWVEPETFVDDIAQQTLPAPVTAVPVPPVPVTPVPTVPAAPSVAPSGATPAPSITEPVAPEETDPAMPNTDGAMEEDFSIGDIPIVETLELTAEKARKALDVYVLVREKYKDAALEDFENLQDFVDQSPIGKAFETDVKAAGFSNVTEWNTTITTLSFAYDNSIDDQTTEITQQITELKADTEMAQDMRERMMTALKAMIPSDNNKKIVEDLKADVAYTAKLKMLETEAQ
jgi:hypothetical protein